MTDAQTYFNYLQKRSFFGNLYRRLYLYPRLCLHLTGRTLDIGCGLGDLLAYRAQTTGVDINNKTIEWCQTQGLEARLMEPDVLPFADCSFDSVNLDNVLEHLVDPTALLKEIGRVLKPNGLFVVGVPGRKGFESDPDHKTYYDEAALTHLLVQSGFNKKCAFSMPLALSWLDFLMRQYCIYGVFEKNAQAA